MKNEKGIAIQTQYPQIVWVPNADTQGTYTSPSNTLVNDPDCAYVVEQLINDFSQDPEKDSCYKSLLNKYSDVLNSSGSSVHFWMKSPTVILMGV
ncbi:hypothetical protein [Chryseobacterium sp. JV274]|uniref:hypothetical protein n=1 Tax=Chryseobacterium sp. JV274 TaxID=1932669 RepID=UPI000986DB9B|nr:hypothetical protein [Chryseobacterium sp. JV274]